MGMYSSLSRGIVKMKKDKDRWRDAYEDIVKRVSDSIESNTNQIRKMELNIHHITKKITPIEERISKNSKHIEGLEEKTKQIVMDVEATSQKNHDTRKDMVEFRNLSEGQLRDMKNLSDRMRKDTTNMEIVVAGMERFKKDARVFVEDALKSHEKSFDAMSRDSLENIKERLKEHSSLDAVIKERMEQIREMIRKEHERIEENRNDIKKFKEYIVSYMNDLLSTYENRFGMLKRDIEYSMERVLKG
jgi:chromosome segregation ATPase